MTDVLDRLRADNPVPVGSAPSIDQLWERLEHNDGGAQHRARPAILTLALVAVVPVAIVVAFALTTHGRTGISSAGRVSGSGGVLHVFRPSHGSATRSAASRRTSPTVLGYKHTPQQLAAARAAEARSYMRHVAKEIVDPGLVREFRLLRQARARPASASSESTIVAAIAGLVPLGATYGADPSQAGETTVGPAKDDVWVVPGSTGACLVDVDGPQDAVGSGCNTASEVDAGDLWTLDTIPYRAGGKMTQVLLGAVPDGNASVIVSWADGTTTVVPVTDNVYSVPIGSHKGWKSVTLKNRAGAVVSVSGMPKLP